MRFAWVLICVLESCLLEDRAVCFFCHAARPISQLWSVSRLLAGRVGIIVVIVVMVAVVVVVIVGEMRVCGMGLC